MSAVAHVVLVVSSVVVDGPPPLVQAAWRWRALFDSVSGGFGLAEMGRRGLGLASSNAWSHGAGHMGQGRRGEMAACSFWRRGSDEVVKIAARIDQVANGALRRHMVRAGGRRDEEGGLQAARLRRVARECGW